MSKKNKISSKEVEHIAKLSKLSLTPGEVKKFQEQLSEIINYVDQLSEVDTKNIPPTSQVTGLVNVFREDIITPSLSQEQVLANAPETHNGYFKVKAVQKE